LVASSRLVILSATGQNSNKKGKCRDRGHRHDRDFHFTLSAGQKHPAELAALAPDVILAHGGSTVSVMQQATRTIPIVFSTASDPVAAGYADSLARPGGNITAL
jgi:ABC transporter substrate binding protein